MNVLGIIAEYNPFHMGHAYQIETLKKETGAAYTIIAMSGNFVQRGAPALMEKYSRTKMALRCGADLVLELPIFYAAASAEHFARGGIALLENTGVVTHLGFGTETKDFTLLQEIAALFNHPPKFFQEALRQGVKKGLSFPAARSHAIITSLEQEKRLPDSAISIKNVLASPNNILAIEYLRALSHYCSNILPCPLLRRGQQYHDTSPGQEFSSASAIRASILERELSQKDFTVKGSYLDTLKQTLPEGAFDILKNYSHPFLHENDFSPLLHYKLLTESVPQLSCYADVSLDLARRIKKEIDSFCSWNSFCSHLKSKNTTYTRLSRMFLHIILNIYHEDYHPFPEPSYLRVLGFCKKAAPLLAAIKSQGKLPIITSPADAQGLLNESAQNLLCRDLESSSLYRIGLAAKGDNQLKNDYQQPFICL